MIDVAGEEFGIRAEARDVNEDHLWWYAQCSLQSAIDI